MSTLVQTSTIQTWSMAEGVRRTLREERLTQSDVARIIGVSPGWMSNRMHGRIKWSLVDAAAVADALGHSLPYVMRKGGYQR